MPQQRLKVFPRFGALTPLDPAALEVAETWCRCALLPSMAGCAYLDGKGDHFMHALEPRKGFLVPIRPSGSGVSSKEACELDEAPE